MLQGTASLPPTFGILLLLEFLEVLVELFYFTFTASMLLILLPGVGRLRAQGNPRGRPDGTGRGGRSVRGQDVETAHLRDREQEAEGDRSSSDGGGGEMNQVYSQKKFCPSFGSCYNVPLRFDQVS